MSDDPIYEVDVILSYEKDNITVNKSVNQLMMLAPFTPYHKDIEIRSESMKNEQMTIKLCWGTSVVSTIVNIPNC